jgi:hypothetical protein
LQEALNKQGSTPPGKIDLVEMAAHFEYIYQSRDEAERKKRNDPPSPAVHPYITVDEHTTEEDVRNAFRLMTTHLPARRRSPSQTRPTALPAVRGLV